MAIITEPTRTTLSVIHEARVNERWSGDSVGINMSALGSDCDRELWYNLRWASPPEDHDAKKLRRFETGNIEEQRMTASLRSVPGVIVIDLDPETDRQWKVFSHGGHVRGKLDGEAIGIVECPDEWIVVEYKSHNDKSFKEILKVDGSDKLKHAKVSHWYQCQKYMQLRQRAKCLYYAVNKDTDAEYQEIILYDAVALANMDERLDRIINSNEAPRRIHENKPGKVCFFCNHQNVCFKQAFGRLHCRTCIHSTPLVGDTNNAVWVCEKHNKTLSLDEQKRGCADHIFLPDVVPGTQIDAGDDWVSYRMEDGQMWVDGNV